MKKVRLDTAISAVVQMFLENDGDALVHVPLKLRTLELCRKAVSNSGWALKYVPEALLTEEICCLAVADYPQAIRYVPEAIEKSVRKKTRKKSG